MAQILLTICDGHPESEQRPAERITLTLETETETVKVEADVCRECKQPLTVAAERLLEIGRPVKPVGRPKGNRNRGMRLTGTPTNGGGNIGQIPTTREPDPAYEDQPLPTGLWACGYCDENSLKNKTARGTHRFRAHGIRSVPLKHDCPFCDFGTTKPHRLDSHVENRHPGEYEKWKAEVEAA